MDNRKRLPTPATGAPVPGTPPAGWPRQQGPGARRRTRGRSPGGPGGVPPHAKERPRRGPEAGGAVFIRPPWGGLILVSPRVRGRRLSQISIVGHYAYENRPATLLPWASNSCTSRHTRAMAPSSTASRANGRRERSPPRPCASLTPAPTWPSPCRPRCCTAAPRQRPRSWPTTGPTAARTPRGASCAPMASPWRLGWCPCPRAAPGLAPVP